MRSRKMRKPSISVNFNGVFIEDVELKRPQYFNVRDWFYFWETTDSFDMEELIKCRQEMKRMRAEMIEMKHTIEDLRDQLKGSKNDY